MTILSNIEKKFLAESNIKLSILLLYGIILSFPFNDSLYLFLRLQDFLVLFFILFNFTAIKRKEFKFILLILFLLIISNITGYFYSNEFYLKKISFFYKILIPLIFFFILKSFLFKNNKNFFLERIVLTIDIAFLLFFFFIFIHYYLRINLFNLSLPEFPGSIILESHSHRGDRHLMGFLVANYFLFRILILIKKKVFNVKNSLALFLLAIFFITIFKSRGGYIVLFFISLIFFFYNIKKINIYQKNKYKIISSFTFIFLATFIFLFKKLDYSIYEFNILSFYYKTQTSIPIPYSDRIYNWFLFLPDNLLLLLLGRGFVGYENIFLDSGFLFVFSSFGLINLLILFFYLKKYFKFNYTLEKDSIPLFYFFILIILNLLISEYFLVSRYIFVTLIMISLLFIYRKKFN